MKMVKTNLAVSAAVAALAFAGAANAAVISKSSVAFDAAPGAGETIVLDFDGTAAAGFLLAGGDVATTSVANQYAAPAGTPAGTGYYHVTALESPATLLTPYVLKTLSIYIGSLDDFNSITFKRGGVAIQSFTGLQLQLPANGDQGDGSTNRRFSFDFTAVGGVDEVVFSSTQNAFEFDNIAVSAVPEPGVWALMISGFGMLGAALRRRRFAVGAAA